MIMADDFIYECLKVELNHFTGTPCSYLKPFINRVIDHPETHYVPTFNEGDAIALASGISLGGKKSCVIFQNSGLGNAVNPLTSLSYVFKIPFLGIVTLRGGPQDEPQHELMGEITTQMLELMQIPWEWFPTQKEDIARVLLLAEKSMVERGLPFFLVMKKNSVAPYSLKDKADPLFCSEEVSYNKVSFDQTKVSLTRTKALGLIRPHFTNDVVIATTGKTGRELFTISDDNNYFYMVGSMGCALPLGLGISLSGYKRKVCVIDGDGACLMRLENMALIGNIYPKQLVHILLDNGVHDSTGGQQTHSRNIDLANIAIACGYSKAFTAYSEGELNDILVKNDKSDGPLFIRLYIKSGSPTELGRPTVHPKEVAQRLRKFINEESNARSYT